MSTQHKLPEKYQARLNKTVREMLLVPGLFLFMISVIIVFTILLQNFQLKYLLIPLAICTAIGLIGCIKVCRLLIAQDEMA